MFKLMSRNFNYQVYFTRFELKRIMGQTLSEPVTAKESTTCANAHLKVGASCMQGWRINMEDAHCHILSLPEDKDAAFFAVYDGHGGAKVAQYAGDNLHKKVVCQPTYKKGDIVGAIKQGFLDIDYDMLKDDTMKDELAGTTAVVVLLRGNKIYCGNVGDSRAVASLGGHVQQLSFDHKPSNEAESKRILAAGGWVEFNRVNGNLALSRALGDFIFKKNPHKPPEEQVVTAYPDVVIKDITPDHEFIVIACDGIWDVLSNEEVVEFIRTRIAAKMEPEEVCEELMTRCLAPDCQMGGLGCDNMTVMVICFLRGLPYDVLAAKCSAPPIQLSAADLQSCGSHNPGTDGSSDTGQRRQAKYQDKHSESVREHKDPISHLHGNVMVETSVRENSETRVA